MYYVGDASDIGMFGVSVAVSMDKGAHLTRFPFTASASDVSPSSLGQSAGFKGRAKSCVIITCAASRRHITLIGSVAVAARSA